MTLFGTPRASIERCLREAVKFYNELQDEILARMKVNARLERQSYLTPDEQRTIANNKVVCTELRHMKSSIVPLITRLELIQSGRLDQL
jgi:hypothetical protein